MAESTQRVDEHVSCRALQEAEQCVCSGQYGKAFANYLLVLKLNPELRQQIKDNFILSMREWGEELAGQQRIDDLMKCYSLACELFPDCDTMLNNMGAQLFRLGFLEEGAGYIRKALRINPTFFAAQANLENICCHLVERWHFRMLNDKSRNEGFRDAIKRAVSKDYNVVLDIGTGTGLLSMYAAKAGARRVYGCEMSKTLYDVACDCVAANSLSDKITLLNKKSTDLVPSEDVPLKPTLLVTETFDAGLLGEHILTTLNHALHQLVSPAKLRVIPAAATVYVCAMECEHIRKQNRFLYPGVRHMDLSTVTVVSQLAHGGYHGDGEGPREPYSSEHLSRVPGGWRKLSKPTHLTKFTFNDLKTVRQYLNSFEATLTLDMTCGGRLDGLALWFDLHLDEDAMLSSAPGTDSCWEQAVYPLLPGQISGCESLLVSAGHSLTSKVTLTDDALHFSRYAYVPTSAAPHPPSPLPSSRVSPTAADSHKDIQGFTSMLKGEVSTEYPWEFSFGVDQCFNGTSLLRNAAALVTSKCDDPPQRASVHTRATVRGTGIVPELTSGTSSEMAASNGAENYFYTDLSQEALPTEKEDVSANGHSNGCAAESASVASSEGDNIRMDSTEADSISRSRENGAASDNPTVLVATRVPTPTPTCDAVFSTGQSGKDHSSSQTSSSSESDSGSSSSEENCDDSDIDDSEDDNEDDDDDDEDDDDEEDDNEDVPSETLSTSDTVFPLHHCEVERLNDLDWNQACCQALEALQLECPADSRWSIVDMTPGFSVLPIQAVALGAAEVCVVTGRGSEWVDGDEEEETRRELLVQKIADCNAFEASSLLFSDDGVDELQGEWSVLMTDLVESHGCLRQQVLEDIAMARVSCLSGGGAVMPHRVEVYGLLLEAPSLLSDSRVLSDTNTLGIQVAEFMNDFTSSMHMDIHFSSLEHTKLSQPVHLFSFNFNESQMSPGDFSSLSAQLPCFNTAPNQRARSPEHLNGDSDHPPPLPPRENRPIPPLPSSYHLDQLNHNFREPTRTTESDPPQGHSGSAPPHMWLPSFLQQDNIVSVPVTEAGQATGILYWFDMYLTPTIKYSTLAAGGHFRQAAVLFRDPPTVSSGQTLRLRACCKNSCIHLSLCDPEL